MTFQLPTPEQVRTTFSQLQASDPEAAVAYLYDLGIQADYIKLDAIAKNIQWETACEYGTLECTINLSKPEKDPRVIAAAYAGGASGAHTTTSDPATNARIPQCDLCWENEDFPGTPEHLAKPGLRIAEIQLGGERWGLQYSPYAYFQEHCIALSERHRPMKIDEACISRLLDFVDQFPFYFIGSNAGLPVVGGSILSHDHFQGGRHVFPLMKAPVQRKVPLTGSPTVTCGIVHWPASTLRLESTCRTQLLAAASRILHAWQSFSYEPCGIRAFSVDEHGMHIPHNTLNPIVHKNGGTYVMHLVLRNNRTDDEHPWGIFHPDQHLHHIKKENIGLIEIMGLAIFPPRLAKSLPAVQATMREAARRDFGGNQLKTLLEQSETTKPHATWAAQVYSQRFEDIRNTAADDATLLNPVVKEEVGKAFEEILHATAMFKQDEVGEAGWRTFIRTLM